MSADDPNEIDRHEPRPAPDGFVRHECTLATLPTAAHLLGVTERTVYAWLDSADPPPVVRPDGRGAPLFHMSGLLLWFVAKKRQSPDFGRWGGDRT